MKIAKPRLDYIFLIYVPFALIGILLNIFFTNTIITILNWFLPITFILALISAIIPFSRQRPLHNSPFIKHKARHWLGKLILLQLAVTFAFIGFTQAIVHFIHSNNPELPAPVLFQQTLNFYQGGIWPWPFVLLVSCAIAYSGRSEKYPAFLRKSVQPVIKHYADNIIGFGIEIFLKQGLLFAGLATISILILQIAHIISQLLHLPSLLTFSIHTAIISIILFIFVANNKFIHPLTRWLWQQKMADNKLILIFSVTAILLLLFFNFCFYLLKFYVFSAYKIMPITLPGINKLTNPNCWFLLSFIWWIGIMPLLTRVLAFITSERSLREILLAGLLLPVLLGAAWGFSSYFAPHVLQNTLAYMMQSPLIGLALSIVSLLITAYCFRNPNTANIASTNKICSPDTQSTVSFLRTLWQLCAYMLGIYLLTNLTFITIIGSAFAAPVFATLFSSLLGCLIIAFTKRKNPR